MGIETFSTGDRSRLWHRLNGGKDETPDASSGLMDFVQKGILGENPLIPLFGKTPLPPDYILLRTTRGEIAFKRAVLTLPW